MPPQPFTWLWALMEKRGSLQVFFAARQARASAAIPTILTRTAEMGENSCLGCDRVHLRDGKIVEASAT
jgi:hypothetical protein